MCGAKKGPAIQGLGFQQHPPAWPCHVDLPSWMRKGMAANASIESNHGRWNTALTAKPASVIKAATVILTYLILGKLFKLLNGS